MCARLLASEPSVDDALLAAARDLREAIDTAVCALSEPDGPPHVVLAAIDGWLPEALVPDRLCADVGRPPVLVPGIAANLGRYALGLLVLRRCSGPSSATAFRVCASETCSARFYDRSRGGGRRWCSMQGCGNVAKARRHRARQVPRG